AAALASPAAARAPRMAATTAARAARKAQTWQRFERQHAGALEPEALSMLFAAVNGGGPRAQLDRALAGLCAADAPLGLAPQQALARALLLLTAAAPHRQPLALQLDTPTHSIDGDDRLAHAQPLLLQLDAPQRLIWGDHVLPAFDRFELGETLR